MEPKLIRQSESGMMPAGEYWIGDLCYAIGDTADSPHLEDVRLETGVSEYTLKGKTYKVANFYTAYGDGAYEDDDGHEYLVDSGGIGCLPLSWVTDPTAQGEQVFFPKPFNAYEKDGNIFYGHVVIRTGDDIDNSDEEDYWNGEEEEDDFDDSED